MSMSPPLLSVTIAVSDPRGVEGGHGHAPLAGYSRVSSKRDRAEAVDHRSAFRTSGHGRCQVIGPDRRSGGVRRTRPRWPYWPVPMMAGMPWLAMPGMAGAAEGNAAMPPGDRQVGLGHRRLRRRPQRCQYDEESRP